MTDIPPELASLAEELRGRSYETAKRRVVSKVGSVRAGERFPDDVADAVFLRIQENAQVGRYASEDILRRLGRNARRLEGEGSVTLYRCAPKGTGIRPGDFAACTREEAGFYRHAGHVAQSLKVQRGDVFQVDGSMGGGQEFVFLPVGYVAPTPVEHFSSFAAFFEAANAPEPPSSPAP